jgi:hypothetical protein
MTTLIIMGLIGFLFLMLCRSLVIWYFGINEIIDLLKEIKNKNI